MIVTDLVHFKMPKDREYQFPAMAVLQAYVNGYEQKMRQNDVAGVKCVRCSERRQAPDKCHKCGETQTVPIATYKINYSHDMSTEDWQLFISAGLTLNVAPSVLPEVDMLVDMSDEKINTFKASGKHVCQICGMLSGIGCPPLPGITRQVPRIGDWQWATIAPFRMDGLTILPGDGIVGVPEQKYTGLIGYASWETYLVASMGLPVIEIFPVGRNRQWLSKWLNGGYRVVDGRTPELQMKQIKEAQLSVQEELTKMALKKGMVSV